ncbi:hypothetical protein PV327_001937 [Microctonus hyperodae]|uniref:ubiquitinyl hydrolase 1 n=1 Tax=Microctonus hyperodae TaxID=165561 RepID=A0AA39FEI9_MICHY|nr:hypothetical protein PV327_001937 [Microctonus hyperodae]
MLSVTSATVHQTMCPTTPNSNSNTTRLVDKTLWSKLKPSISKKCRNIIIKKKIPIYISTESALNDKSNRLKNVSLSVVAATKPDTSEEERPAISFTVKENVWAANKNEENTVVANEIGENEIHWCFEDNDEQLSSGVGETFERTENNPAEEFTVERKRKRGVQGRMANAVKYLKTSENVSVPTISESNQLNTISNVSKDNIPCETSQPVHNNEVEPWITKDEEENWEKLIQPDNFYTDAPYYMTGFPNPPGENRCWLNATLHTLFILPLIDYLDHVDSNDCSRLTKTLVTIQQFWREGVAEKDKIYQIVKKFKEELSVLDETYASQKQQDVSEFLMIFLNYIKTEWEQLATTAKSTRQITHETENVPENGQKIVSNISRVQTTPKKRVPLATISPLKQANNNINEAIEKNVGVPSLENLELESIQATEVCNPIDRFFLLHMLEHYICKGCSEHRQRNIDNLMLYVDIPNKETESIDLTVAIGKSMEPEERSLTCAKCKHALHNVSMSFRKSPAVLMVQVNRYGMTNEGIVEKVNTAVDIPHEFTLDRHDEIDRFKPIGIIAHVGSAMDCGHYTSYAEHDDQWYHYNDMDVVPMSKDEALAAARTTAYLVFFVNVKLNSNKSSEVFDNQEDPLR